MQPCRKDHCCLAGHCRQHKQKCLSQHSSQCTLDRCGERGHLLQTSSFMMLQHTQNFARCILNQGTKLAGQCLSTQLLSLQCHLPTSSCGLKEQKLYQFKHQLLLLSRVTGMLTLASAFKLSAVDAVLDAAVTQRTKDRQIAKTATRNALLLFTENMLEWLVRSQKLR